MSENVVKKDLYYTEDHEWVAFENGIATVGVSDYAQHQMGDIVFVELPEVGDEFSKGDDFAVIESVKAASDSFIPVSGEIVEVNEELEDEPEKINAEPYDAWLVKVKVSDESELDALMSAGKYETFVEGLEG